MRICSQGPNLVEEQLVKKLLVSLSCAGMEAPHGDLTGLTRQAPWVAQNSHLKALCETHRTTVGCVQRASGLCCGI